jgi:hypothetical protein
MFSNLKQTISRMREWLSKVTGTPKFIAVACVLFFGGYIALVTLQDPATTDNGIVNLVLGYLGGIVSSIISFYYGASHKHDE